MESVAFTQTHPIFSKLEEMASYAGLSQKNRRLYEADLKAYRTQIGQIEYAYEEGTKN